MSVYSTASLGKGFPDLTVGFRGKTFLLEIKDPDQPISKRRLTKDETLFHEKWSGHVAVVETIEQAFAAVGCPLKARATPADSAR
jgi:hypothetical protein